MQKIMSIGTPPWTRQDLLDKLEQFADLYSRRPIKDNTGGMKSPHMFYTWIVLQYLQPEAVVESGVFKGQSTWLIEQVCPEAQIYSIDPFPTHIQYRSSKAEYFYRDFSTLDWQHLPKEKTLLFF